MAVISGTTKDATGAFASRTVRAHRCSDGALAGSAVPINATGAYAITAIDTSPHYVLAFPVAFDPHWDKVSLLLHMDDTGLTDEKGHAVTINGGVSRSATQSLFGGYSALFDGTSGYLWLADHADFELGGGDFDIEAAIYLTGYCAGYTGVYNSAIVSKDAAATRGFSFLISGTSSSWTALNFIGFEDNANYTLVTGSFAFSLNTFYRVRVTRVGNLVFLFVNGVLLNAGGTAFSRTIQNTTTTPLTIGGQGYSGYEYYLPCHMEEVRLTKGVGRESATHTPLDIAFPHAYAGGPDNAQIFDNITPV